MKTDIFQKYSYIINTESYQSQKNYIQHGKTSVFDHAVNVASLCQEYLEKKNIECDDLVIAALLHDYFLYDWHDKKQYPRKGLHGFTHAKDAANNAIRDFNISKKSARYIRCHMFPMNLFTGFPNSKFAWVLWHFDNVATFKEVANK